MSTSNMHMAVSQISLPRRSASVLAWQNNTKSTLIRSKTLLNAALIQARFKIVHLIAGFLRNHFELLEVVRCNGQSLGRATGSTSSWTCSRKCDMSSLGRAHLPRGTGALVVDSRTCRRARRLGMGPWQRYQTWLLLPDYCAR
ncbi:hypothetical protein K443DRAFT_582512 [Laccaria amethystina LaAM-08-1]|uniref:Uncharacterized protein n=1 Tax=Laccaria amethystina LaAM-08-1 TaxID=1095629 RepID=A0A0C9XHH5_9AGAR|nr:hypothetical protein K443DRAFT_582512 [Laccaria amethystina LaAM-08-1]